MRRKHSHYAWLFMIAVFFVAIISIEGTAQEKPKPLKGKTVNINNATEEELVKSVPLITLDLAKKIVKYRKENGNFQTFEELLQVDGFDRTLLRRIKPFLLLEGIGGKECTC